MSSSSFLLRQNFQVELYLANHRKGLRLARSQCGLRPWRPHVKSGKNAASSPPVTPPRREGNRRGRHPRARGQASRTRRPESGFGAHACSRLVPGSGVWHRRHPKPHGTPHTREEGSAASRTAGVCAGQGPCPHGGPRRGREAPYLQTSNLVDDTLSMTLGDYRDAEPSRPEGRAALGGRGVGGTSLTAAGTGFVVDGTFCKLVPPACLLRLSPSKGFKICIRNEKV